MKSLNKILNTFTSTITKLDNLATVNEQKAGIAGDKIAVLVKEKTSLEKEAIQAEALADKLREFIKV